MWILNCDLKRDKVWACRTEKGRFLQTERSKNIHCPWNFRLFSFFFFLFSFSFLFFFSFLSCTCWNVSFQGLFQTSEQKHSLFLKFLTSVFFFFFFFPVIFFSCTCLNVSFWRIVPNGGTSEQKQQQLSLKFLTSVFSCTCSNMCFFKDDSGSKRN